jgi:hypothetical protein
VTTAKKGGEDFRQGAMGAALKDGVVASKYLARTENLIAERAHKRVEDIRPGVASKLRITASAAHFIRRGRRKIVPSWLMDKIIALFIETAQAELRAIEHEIEVARQIGLDPRDDALLAAKTRAASLVAILEGTVGKGPA